MLRLFRFISRPSNSIHNFALAYAWMGIAYNDMGELSMDVESTRKAYELRDRTSEPEKYFITARYHKVVYREPGKGRRSSPALDTSLSPRGTTAYLLSGGNLPEYRTI